MPTTPTRTPKIYPHGDFRRYVSKRPEMRCRCDECRAAHRDRMAAYRKQRAYGRWQPARVDATGTRRRLQALMAIGHLQTDIAVAIGRSYDAVDRYLFAKQVHRDTAATVADLYRRWAWTPGPHRYRRTRSYNRGWVSPLGWDGVDIDDPHAQPRQRFEPGTDDCVDDIAVARAAGGDAGALARLTAAEQAACAALLHQRRVPVAAIARRLGCSIYIVGKLLNLAAQTASRTEDAA